MLLRIGTQKYHLFISILNYYENKQFNLFELGFAPWIGFTITLIPLEIFIGIKGYVWLLLRDNEIIFKDKLINLRRNK